MLRQPIVVVMGHVDHGKTSILDSIRQTTVASREAGAITQHIGASEVPLSVIKETCKPVAKLIPVNLTIPGLLMVDTPGHAAFTNLRKRGGSIADLAILVVDVAQGFQPQTIEAIEILKEYKTPFVIAANKIDLITGWKTRPNSCFIESLPTQRQEVQEALDNKIYTLIGELSKYGLNAERFDRVSDFTKNIAIIPVSAKTREGIPELLIFLAGLAQKFLEKQLQTEEAGPGKGSILEIKFEKGLGVTADVILYDGVIRKGDTVVFMTKAGAKSAKIRGLLKPKPLVEMRDVGDRFNFVDEIVAASGVKIFTPDMEEALPGSELFVARSAAEEAQLKEKLEAEIKEILVKTENAGIILRADTLGSVEAITRLLETEGIHLRRADVGPVMKTDVMEAVSIRAQDRYAGGIMAFNVNVPSELAEEAKSKGVPVISSKIIYALFDQYKEWKAAEQQREKEEALAAYVFPAKVRFMPGYAFRANKPAVFGIEVLIGRMKQGDELIKEDGTIVGRVKSIQKDKVSIQEARVGDEVAISIDEPIIGRHIFEGDIFYTNVPLKHALVLQQKYKSLLTGQELDLLDMITRLTRK